MAIRHDRIAGDTREMALLKQELHRQTNGWLNAALDNHYWVEAICIAESLMSDRIESYFTKNYESRKISTLGSWCREILEIDKLSKADIDLFERVKAWSKLRNKAVHELVKVSERHKTSWDERVCECMTVAREGKRLSVEVNNWSKRKVKS